MVATINSIRLGSTTWQFSEDLRNLDNGSWQGLRLGTLMQLKFNIQQRMQFVCFAAFNVQETLSMAAFQYPHFVHQWPTLREQSAVGGMSDSEFEKVFDLYDFASQSYCECGEMSSRKPQSKLTADVLAAEAESNESAATLIVELGAHHGCLWSGQKLQLNQLNVHLAGSSSLSAEALSKRSENQAMLISIFMVNERSDSGRVATARR